MKPWLKIVASLIACTFVLLVSLTANQTQAQAPQDEGLPIKLQSRTFTPTPGFDPTVAARLSSQTASSYHLLVQLHHHPTEAERAALRAAGVNLLGYIPEQAWLASVNAGFDLAAPTDRLIRWVGPLLPTDKISLALRQHGVAAWALGPGDQVTLQLIFFKDVTQTEANQVISRHQGQVQQAHAGAAYVARFPDAQVIEALAAEDTIQWLDSGPAPRHFRDTPTPDQGDGVSIQNDVARDHTNVNALQTAHPETTGTGTRLGVWDGGVDPNHPDFTGRLVVVPDHPQPSNDHGTHVAGTMAGDGRNSINHGGTENQWRGIATTAQIFSYSNDNTWFETHQGAIQTDNIDLSQNSWGGNFTSQTCDTHNLYSLDAQQMDKLVTGEAYQKRIVSSVAASNFREGTSDDQNEQSPICGYSDVPPFINYTSLSDLGSAKNILSVGATQKNETNEMANFSSWGPTRDGRLKPDIAAPGQDIRSAFPGGGYGEQSGTSMATPHISGIASLLIQRYRTVFNTQEFLPSTIKAILLQTAKDLNSDFVYYTPGPDYASGYGLADALAAYEVVTPSLVLEAQLANSATNLYTLTVTSPDTPLKVTLAWDDPAPELNADPQLVNNLDLELVAPDGVTTQLPWLLDPANPANAATTGVDNLNNVEQVYVANPAAGTWTIRVKGTSVPQGPQRYSLVSSLAIAGSTGPGTNLYLPVIFEAGQ